MFKNNFGGLLLAGLLFPASLMSQPMPQHSEIKTRSVAADETPTPVPRSVGAPTDLNILTDRIIAREHDEMTAINLYTPIVETYIQEVKPNKVLGTLPKSDVYFLGQADLKGKVKLHSMLDRKVRIPSMYSFSPQGFLQMIYIDRYHFDREHYTFHYAGRDFLGDVRCILLDINPAPKSHGAYFVGRIWVEDQNNTIVRFNGEYAPAIRFSFSSLSDEYYFHFDSWRTNVKNGLWLPTYIYSQELDRRSTAWKPLFKSQTRMWGYSLNPNFHEEELSKLVVETQSGVDDESTGHDFSPLDQLRTWRREAERNVLDVLQQDGLLAPTGPVDQMLNKIVTNLEVGNNLDSRIDFHCRVLTTSTFDAFSIGNAIVLSRGLIDVLPDEGTLAAIIAQEIADAMVPKPAQDQYGFSDIMLLAPTEVLKKLSFQDSKTELADNSQEAVELLRNSIYVGKLGKTGLFLEQLNYESKALKQLISPRLGNRLAFAAQLSVSAPALEVTNKDQITALPIGSRIIMEPWADNINFLKAKPLTLNSAREKMPFEVTAFEPYLTRYEQAAASVSAIPASAQN